MRPAIYLALSLLVGSVCFAQAPAPAPQPVPGDDSCCYPETRQITVIDERIEWKPVVVPFERTITITCPACVDATPGNPCPPAPCPPAPCPPSGTTSTTCTDCATPAPAPMPAATSTTCYDCPSPAPAPYAYDDYDRDRFDIDIDDDSDNNRIVIRERIFGRLFERLRNR